MKLIAISAIAALACLPAQAQASNNRPAVSDKYTIIFPQGWATQPDGNNIEVRAPQSVGDAWCRTNSNAMPSLVDSTQAGLNEDFKNPWDAKTWGDVLTVAGDKLQVSNGVTAVVDGHVVQTVTITFAKDVFGNPVTARITSHVLVGRMVNAACFTRSETFEGLRALFETTVSSLKPA